MSKNEWKKWVGVVGRMLLAYALVVVQGAWAGQDQKTNDKSGSQPKATAQQANEKQSAAPAKAAAQSKQAHGEESQTSVAGEEPSRDGSHEGIKVHGHWTIEVRDRDGSLVRHVEFENALDPGFTTTTGLTTTAQTVVSGGASYLSGVLSGQWSAPGTPGGTAPATPPIEWAVFLVGPAGLSNLASTANAPCALPAGILFPGACQMYQSVTLCPGNVYAGASCQLSVTPLGTSPNFNGIRLTGSVAATQPGQISTVATLILGPACATYASNCAAVLNTPLPLASITSSTNFPGAPITVAAGQTIAVTVNISFS